MSDQYPMFFKIFDADNNVLCEGYVHSYCMKKDISPVYDRYQAVELVPGRTHIEMDGTILHTPPAVPAKAVAEPRCECGAEKAKSIHSSWCPVA